jgi:AcrR family transcriptional regulator
MPTRIKTIPRKTASQDRSRATIDAILGATARVLVKHGYEGASTNKIAEAAGVSIGSLYQYFPSKEALVAAVIEHHIGSMMDLIRSSIARVVVLPLREAAREMVRVMVEAHRLAPKLHRVLVEQIPRIGDLDQIDRLDRETESMVRLYLEARKDEIGVEDLEMAAFMAVACVESMTHVAVLRRPELLSDPRFEDEVAAMVVRYLEGDPPKSRAAMLGRTP